MSALALCCSESWVPVYHPIVDGQQLRERTIRQVQDAVSQMFGLSTEELRTKSRSRDVVLPRQVAMYLAKQLTQASLPEIGQEFGGKHQTSVMHSISRIHHLRTLTPEWTRLYGIF
jgi:chromosomal replication initiator protein